MGSQTIERGSAGLAERLREEMTAWDAALQSAFRLPAYSPDDLLTSKGIDLYDRMMTDAMVRAAINTKRYALLARPWQILPAAHGPDGKPTPEAERACRFADRALRQLRGPDGTIRDFRQSLFQMMSAFYRGFSVAEMIWRVETTGEFAGKYTLSALKAKHPKQLGFEVDDYLNITGITSWTPQQGSIRVPRDKCVLYIYNPHDELPYGESDLRSVYKHWWSKDTLMKFWNLTLQRYGLPLMYVQSSQNLSDEGANRLLDLLRSLQQDASAVFPRDTSPQLLQASPGSTSAFTEAVDWHNQQIAQGILLQTLTSGEGRRVGSMALGKVHFDVLLYVLENAREDLEAVVNTQIIWPLIAYNFADPELVAPKFTLGSLNEKNIVQLAQAYNVLLTHGVASPHEQAVREAFGLPPLEDAPTSERAHHTGPEPSAH